MNDRYLYRAKRISPLELPKEKSWIEGYYAYMKPFHYIMPKGSFDSWYRIDEKTLCQCTGLKDKNGKLIWENDICRRILLPTKRIKTNFKIAYVPYKCCLSAKDLDGENVTFLSDYINNQYEVEVIGNVFDNPELLEVK